MTQRFTTLAVLLLALAVLAGRLTAEDKKDEKGQHDHHAKEFLACAKACDDCARECDACSRHCATLAADGKKEHLTTLRTCQDCATTCRASSAIVSRSGPFSGTICTACAEACKKCGDACEKFDKDEMMKKCADECRKCEKACKEMLAHLKHMEK